MNECNCCKKYGPLPDALNPQTFLDKLRKEREQSLLALIREMRDTLKQQLSYYTPKPAWMKNDPIKDLIKRADESLGEGE